MNSQINLTASFHPARPGYVSFAAILWIMVWAGIDTGPWVLRRFPANLLGWVHYLRTLFPLAALLVASLVMVEKGRFGNRALFGPIRLWLFYGLISLTACINSPKPFDAAYWAINYLSVFAAISVFLLDENKLSAAIHLNYVCWAWTALLLIVLVVVSRDALFVDYRYGWITGYGIVNRMKSIANIAMSRSSGMARFAAIPGITAFVFLFSRSGWKRFLWILPFILSALLIWLMQSRGAILGFVFAMSFVMLFLGPRSRWLAAVGFIVVGMLHFTNSIPIQAAHYVKRYFYRGMTPQELETLTGRTRAWKKALRQIKKSPILGRGPQADRYLIREHVHNTYLYALLQGGITGAATFAAGLIWAWILFFQAILRKTAGRQDNHFLIQAGGILAFFTVRSIPEVCGAMFGVDLMVMAPIIAYLGLLNRSEKNVS